MEVVTIETTRNSWKSSELKTFVEPDAPEKSDRDRQHVKRLQHVFTRA